MSSGRSQSIRRLHALGVAATGSGRPVVGARLLREALRLAGNDEQHRALRGRILLSLGFAVAEQGRVAHGLRLFDQGAALLDQQPIVHAQRGALLARHGRTLEAIPHLDRAVAALGAAGETHEFSRALLNRGYARLSAGQLRQARADFQRCLRLARECGAESVAVKSIQNQGYLDFLAGNVPLALRRLDEAARECSLKLPSYLPVIATDKARVLLSVGLAADACRELALAISSFGQQRASHDRAGAELTMAAAQLLAGNPEEAGRYAAIARRRFLGQGNRTWAELASLWRLRAAFDAGTPPGTLGRRGRLVAGRLAGLGLTDDARSAALLSVRGYLRAGRPGLATEAAATIRPPRQGDPLEVRLSWHQTRAELAAAAGDGRRQLRHLRAGLTSLQRHRSLLGSIDLQTGIAALGRELAAAGLASALASGLPGRVFQWAELARAQAFRVYGRPPDDPVMTNALEELRHARFELRQAALRREPTGRLRARSTDLERTVRERAWLATGSGASGPVATLAAVRGLLARHDEAMVLFLRRRDRLAALVLAARSLRLMDLGGYRPVDENLRRLRADLDTMAGAIPPRMVEAVRRSRWRVAQRLAEQLFDPLLASIGDRKLVIIPTGALFGTPWSQLEPLRGRPVVVAPSATAWAATQVRVPAPEPRRVLLVAGPEVPNAAAEVRSIAAILPDPVCLAGRDATPAAVLDLLDGAPLAHVAAHGHHEPANALFSSIDLADGSLMGYDLQRLPRPPSRVVLSACELGRSSVRAGDEILGMVAALLAAGSSTVIASVASPVDQTVPDVMIPFHRLLADGRDPAEALARATVDQPESSFVCFGSG
ncbi:MAG TPA: CHAT domain-containing protein [Pseudonocardiaceae bacterium]|nr:CHAT domain-containing protein [Pseudonocardiaceae bacterium]